MGLGVAISGSVMMITFLGVVMALGSSIDANYAIFNHAMSERMDIDIALMKTSVSIESVQSSPNDDVILAVINNIGSEKLWQYHKFTVLVTYDANITNTKTRLTENLQYIGIVTTVPSGGWGITQFIDDLTDPRIINSGEKAQIKCRVQYPAYPGGTTLITLSTENGSVASKSGVVS